MCSCANWPEVGLVLETNCLSLLKATPTTNMSPASVSVSERMNFSDTGGKWKRPTGKDAGYWFPGRQSEFKHEGWSQKSMNEERNGVNYSHFQFV